MGNHSPNLFSKRLLSRLAGRW